MWPVGRHGGGQGRLLLPDDEHGAVRSVLLGPRLPFLACGLEPGDFPGAARFVTVGSSRRSRSGSSYSDHFPALVGSFAEPLSPTTSEHEPPKMTRDGVGALRMNGEGLPKGLSMPKNCLPSELLCWGLNRPLLLLFPAPAGSLWSNSLRRLSGRGILPLFPKSYPLRDTWRVFLWLCHVTISPLLPSAAFWGLGHCGLQLMFGCLSSLLLPLPRGCFHNSWDVLLSRAGSYGFASVRAFPMVWGTSKSPRILPLVWFPLDPLRILYGSSDIFVFRFRFGEFIVREITSFYFGLVLASITGSYDLAYNKKLQNLDLGNNLITRWSDLKVRHQEVLSSLVGLKNLNLQGNPIAENDKLTKKVRTLLPNLHVFNAKPINKNSKNEKGSIDDKVDDSSHNTANNLKAHKEEKGDHIWLIDSKQQVMRQNEDGNPGDLVMETELKQQRKKLNEKRSKEESRHSIDDSAVKKKLNNKSKEKQHELDNEKNSKRHMTDLNKDGHLNDSRDVDMEKELKRKRKKTDDKLLMEEVQVHYYNKSAEKKQKKRSKEDQSELDVIDDAETSFQEFFSVNSSENQRIYGESKVVEGAHQNMNLVGAVLTSSAKKKKSQNHSMTSALQLSQEVEVGLGGSSTWGDE
ncbi:hypothetical protein JRO89_XS10G0203900 [Xanthoceras sorbifolium]|uniref:Uncharacterized protein n=1 Tax=Xanthoceras sorbifolium TaxID=99658 RepID=A0ABQ8HJL8_9ROSI|nr:hypothetical protein JRO89_XS10G0203900 [Xanthoceras sorbifolium]